MTIAVASVIKLTPLFIIVALVVRSRRFSAADRHVLWLLFFLAAALLPLASMALPEFLPLASTSKVTKAVYLAGVRLEEHASASTLRLFWLAGVAFFAGRDVIALAASARTSRRSTGIVFAENDVPPHTVFRRIILPASARAWPQVRMRCVLLHEIAHIRRRDFLTQLGARLVCALFWFQPLMWMALRRLAIEQERACDDAAIAAGATPTEYAEALLDLVRVFRSAPAVSMASHLVHRVEWIVDPDVRRSPMRTGVRNAFVVAAMTLALLLAPLQAGTFQAEITRTARATHIFAGDAGHYRMEFKDGSEVVLAGGASFGATIADLHVERGSRVTVRGRGTEYVFEHDRRPEVDAATRAWLDRMSARMQKSR